MNKKILLIIIIILNLLLPFYSFASFQDGLEAAQNNDFDTAYGFWKKSSDLGDPASQFNIGLLYTMGLGVNQNYREAFKWFELSASQGLAEAQYHLGLLYFEGLGVKSSYKDSFYWFKLASDQNLPEAQYYLDDLLQQHPKLAQQQETDPPTPPS